MVAGIGLDVVKDVVGIDWSGARLVGDGLIGSWLITRLGLIGCARALIGARAAGAGIPRALLSRPRGRADVDRAVLALEAVGRGDRRSRPPSRGPLARSLLAWALVAGIARVWSRVRRASFAAGFGPGAGARAAACRVNHADLASPGRAQRRSRAR